MTKKEPKGLFYVKFWTCLNDAAKIMQLPERSTLPLRTYKHLQRVGIIRRMRTTNISLDDYSDSELLSIPGLGKKSLNLARIANHLYLRKE